MRALCFAAATFNSLVAIAAIHTGSFAGFVLCGIAAAGFIYSAVDRG